ncbi:hypothetical protein AMAG_16689 [Allomyces macrogynus ATCC 38327]|uniref:Uncharacterized protein n=1 Tax=Allomyces macrogynus (strain ATCC 38327) TaxID=578462 RepID=A0A0L0TBX9_ALLM3|nr:hypothetical protein AMAG_16689 [Allomyces macrogynus ATCC 38327]|eukprot:KNE72205.1 hypothetical protein AMAG_16689 [Allomyces macrogynus ATCC 38327]
MPPSSSTMRYPSSASAPSTPAKPAAYAPRSPIDGKPSLLVRCSAGGETDPRMFYATTHCTYFHARNTMQNVATERTLNTQFRWDDEAGKVGKRVQAAGYQRNLLPCFEYDAGVDESVQFRMTDHFATTQSTSFTTPAAPPNVQTTKRINNIPELSKYQPVQSAADVKLDGKWAEFESTMKASYREHAMFPHVDRTLPMTGMDHESGWVRDRPHEIAGLSDTLSKAERGVDELDDPRDVQRAKHALAVSFVGATGYNRPDAVLPEIDTTKPYRVQPFYLAHLRKRSRLEHQFLVPANADQMHNPVKVDNGLKEPSGAVREQAEADLFAQMQFRSWDTSYSASYDPMAPGTPTSPARVNRAANRSGYSLCNRYEFEPFEPEIPEHARAKTADAMLQAARDRREYSETQRV